MRLSYVGPSPGDHRIVAGTGHRPNKLLGYGREEQRVLVDFAARVLVELDHGPEGPITVISGMALGWDQALAEAAVESHIEYWAYVPFFGFDAKWPQFARDHLSALLDSAEKTKYICVPGYAAWKLHQRNKAMVEDAGMILALHNGDQSGGTYACLQYALERQKKVLNVWEEWQDHLLWRDKLVPE